jgi:Site-specific recombinase XerD
MNKKRNRLRLVHYRYNQIVITMSLYRLDQTLDAVRRRIKKEKYSDDHKKEIFRFENFLYTESLSTFRIIKHLTQINVIFRTFPILSTKLTEDDVITIIGWIEKTKINNETNTSYKTTLKKYLTFQKSKKLISIIKFKKRKTNPILPEEILTEDEITRLINTATSERNRAFIAGIYEAGARISEFGTMKIKHLTIDEFGLKATVSGKTGMRIVRLVFSTPYILNWLDVHPYRDNPEAPLWITDARAGGKPRQIEYAGFRKLIRETAAKANIKKRIYNQLFRHSRITHMASKLTESQLKIIYGWTPDSNMPKIYIHLSGQDVEDAVLNIYGLKKSEDKTPTIGIIRCIRCRQSIPTINKFCPYCGAIQTTETAIELINFEEKAKNLMFRILKENPELISILEEIQH